MKNNATLLLLLVSFFCHTNVRAFSQGITIKVTDASLDKVFGLIQKQTNFVFIYSGKQLAGTKKVSVDVENEKFEKVMQMVMDGQPIKYEIDKEYVIIKQKHITNLNYLEESDFSLPGELSGKVINEKGEPIIGATIKIKGSDISVATDAEGTFLLKGVGSKGELIITCVGYEPKIIKLTGDKVISVLLLVKAQPMQEVTVYNNGYQTLTPDRSVGSYSVIDNKLISRSISSNIVDRIKNVAAGILFTDLGSDPIVIRGKGTILGDAAPLIIVDNFQYNGSITNINPNDVENVTILKDASAASIWGARASNGVIVITTKKGKTSKPQVALNTIVTIQNKPNLFTQPIISSSDFIDLEKYLFEKGIYDNEELYNDYNYGHPAFTPVVELLLAKRKGIIQEDEVNRKIEEYKKIDARDDIGKYLYRRGVSQQYNLNVSGNTPFLNYYMSVGWDNSMQNLVGDKQNRVTINSRNNFKITDKLQAAIDINFVNDDKESGANPGAQLKSTKDLYPYASIADANGNSLPIVKNLRQLYVDSVGGGRLKDWSYKPIEEIYNTDVFSKSRSYQIGVALKYQLIEGLGIEAMYQFFNQINNNGVYSKLDSYQTRDLINRFTQVLPNGSFYYPVPSTGGIMDRSNSEQISHQGRIGFRYNHSFEKHNLSALGGWEICDKKNSSSFSRYYGYNEESSLVSPVIDYITMFKKYDNPYESDRISNSAGISNQTDRFISYYMNVGYQFDGKYLFSASGRNDAANLLGAETNKQRGLPLWSIGGGWLISEESFFKSKAIKLLKFRTSFGFNGNISRLSTAETTIKSGVSPSTGLETAIVVNPPNEKLRWEKVGVFNLGLEFGLRNDRITGSVEYYNKNAQDLMGAIRVDPSLGVGQFLVTNSASMKGKGVEVTINTKNIDGKISWYTTYNFSYAFSKVTKYNYINSSLGKDYLDAGIIVGKPLNTIYSYKWAGLNPDNGNPLGYKGKEISENYGEIINNTSLEDMEYGGVKVPTIFGNLMNGISYRNINLSFNISYQFGHILRRQSVRYSGLLSGTTWTAHSDYGKRWQKKGDELITNVPSLSYPANAQRDNFYAYASVNLVKADNIRLEDIRVSWSLSQKLKKHFLLKNVNVFAYSNLGIMLWKRNSIGYDPYVREGIRQGRSFSFGLSIDF